MIGTLPTTLHGQIDTILTNAALTVDRTTVTAGEPAAPTGQCTAVWIWAAEIFDRAGSGFTRRGDDVGCLVAPAVRIAVRIDHCYTERDDGAELTDAEHASDASAFHALVDAIYQGLIDLWAAGDLLDGVSCKTSKVGDVTIDSRQGGIVSASLYVETEV